MPVSTHLFHSPGDSYDTYARQWNNIIHKCRRSLANLIILHSTTCGKLYTITPTDILIPLISIDQLNSLSRIEVACACMLLTSKQSSVEQWASTDHIMLTSRSVPVN